MKKYIRLLITITLLLTVMLSTFAFANVEMIVLINNKEVNFNRLHNGQPVGEPFIENNRTYLPIRVISEDLGYNGDWKEESKTAVITKGKTTVEITIGKSTALVNGVRKPIDTDEKGNVRDTKAMMKGGRTYVPVRFIAEAMGDKVEYRHPSTSNVKKPTVYINCTGLPEEKPVVKPEPPVVSDKDVVVPEFLIVPHTKAGGADFQILLNNVPKFKELEATFSSELISHPQFNKGKVWDEVGKSWVEFDETKQKSNYKPRYNVPFEQLIYFKIRESNDFVSTLDGKNFSTIRPKTGEVLVYNITVKTNKGTSQKYEVKVPYRNFTEPVYTSGTKIQ